MTECVDNILYIFVSCFMRFHFWITNSYEKASYNSSNVWDIISDNE